MKAKLSVESLKVRGFHLEGGGGRVRGAQVCVRETGFNQCSIHSHIHRNKYVLQKSNLFLRSQFLAQMRHLHSFHVHGKVDVGNVRSQK